MNSLATRVGNRGCPGPAQPDNPKTEASSQEPN
jgi:hypothetical protein